jgi:hypothetical protein
MTAILGYKVQIFKVWDFFCNVSVLAGYRLLTLRLSARHHEDKDFPDNTTDNPPPEITSTDAT